VASGITSVWDTGTDAAKIAQWRRDLSHGKFMGPRVVRSDAAAPAPQRERGAVALNEELAARVRAGQTPAAVLRSATIEAATFHDRGQDLGSIEQGKIADLIVLGGDPLADIAHTRTIDAVVFRGEVLTRAHLNQLLSQAGRPGAR
jgi:cytosine/adenosine deaminase-related metal-dependent hydrolase